MVVTIAVAIAMLATLPAFRTKFRNADTTPYRARETVLRTALTFGDYKMPIPLLWQINAENTINIEEEGVSLVKIKSPVPQSVKPVNVNILQPNRSDSLPLRGPSKAMHMAPGTMTNPDILGVKSKTLCR